MWAKMVRQGARNRRCAPVAAAGRWRPGRARPRLASSGSGVTAAVATIKPALRERLERRLAQYDDLLGALSAPSTADDDLRRLTQEMVGLEPGALLLRELQGLEAEATSLRSLSADAAVEAELREMAAEELDVVLADALAVEQKLLRTLLPVDEADDGTAILEIRAGTGGDEATIFAANLYDMYTRAGATRNWRLEVLSATYADTGSSQDGYKEVIARVHGDRTFAQLRFESGVHRVQRVPATESKGRVHTSTVSVVILPEPTEVDQHVDPKDLRIDVYRASGAGGQHVNTTESAVRVTHLPTGITAAIQDERSQHQNRAKALALIAARVYEARRLEEQERLSGERRAQIGSGDRSERIRTYNFMQNRVTDHRIGLTIYGLDAMLDGGETFDSMLEGLQDHYDRGRLDALLLDS